MVFKGQGKNTFGLGATVRAFVEDQILYAEHMPMRGFQSSMDYKLILGLGNNEFVDSLIVTWPDDKKEVFTQVKTNQEIILDQANATKTLPQPKKKLQPPLFAEVDIPEIKHTENQFNEFDRERLLNHMVSTEGPAFTVADLNQDGLDDFYLGGSQHNPGALYMQTVGTNFTKLQPDIFELDSLSDDVDAIFFDADGDKDLDLYVVSGGTEHSALGLPLRDRLYRNQGLKNGRPAFEKTSGMLPAHYQAGSCVQPADFDNDGDLDLFVGTRVRPAYYGLPCDQLILMNDGNGKFTNVSSTVAPEFKSLGLVTDARWFDYDQNSFPDLIVVGDWMPVTVFLNDGKKLTRNRSIHQDLKNQKDGGIPSRELIWMPMGMKILSSEILAVILSLNPPKRIPSNYM